MSDTKVTAAHVEDAVYVESSTDTISRTLAQAHAIIDLVSTLHGGDNGLCVETLGNSMWAAKELINEARAALDQLVDERTAGRPGTERQLPGP